MFQLLNTFSFYPANNAVSPNDVNDKHLAYVIDAVYAVARGLQTLQSTLCPGQTRVCIEMTRASGNQLRNFIVQQNFYSINQDRNIVSFNTLGDGEPVYDVYNYQSEYNGGPFEFVKVRNYLTVLYLLFWTQLSSLKAKADLRERALSTAFGRGPLVA